MKKLLLLLLLIPIVCFSQSSKVKSALKKVQMNVRNFDASQPISLDKISNSTNLGAEFENALFYYGFDVISNRVAQNIVEFDNPLNPDVDKIIIKKYTNVKSVYVLTISGRERADTGCGGVVPSSIIGRIIDMKNDGKLVGTFRFSQSNWGGKCASDIAEAVVIKLKEISKNK